MSEIEMRMASAIEFEMTRDPDYDPSYDYTTDAVRYARAAMSVLGALRVAVPADKIRQAQYEHFGADDEPLGPCVLVIDLPTLGIEAR